MPPGVARRDAERPSQRSTLRYGAQDSRVRLSSARHRDEGLKSRNENSSGLPIQGWVAVRPFRLGAWRVMGDRTVRRRPRRVPRSIPFRRRSCARRRSRLTAPEHDANGSFQARAKDVRVARPTRPPLSGLISSRRCVTPSAKMDQSSRSKLVPGGLKVNSCRTSSR
jgi:hypothetical protein